MSDKNSVRILVIGSINMDLVISLKRNPEPGETVIGSGYSYIPGGKGANQAVAAARLGAQVAFCGRVGDDPNGEGLTDSLKGNGIDVSYLKKDCSLPTGLAVIPVDESGQNRIIVIPGANFNVSREDVDNALDEWYDVILLQLEIPLPVVYYIYERAFKKGIPVILDAGPAMKIDLARFKGIKILTPNESEAYALTGIKVTDEETALKAAQTISIDSGAEYVVLKLGDRGALLYTDGKHELFPAFNDIKVVDTTAAGDSFTAAMAVKLIETGNIRESVRYANAVGAVCVSRMGAQPSLPTKEDVEEFLGNQYKEEVWNE